LGVRQTFLAATLKLWSITPGKDPADSSRAQPQTKGRAPVCPTPVVVQFAPWPKDLLCVLCESLAFFAVKVLLYRKASQRTAAKNAKPNHALVKLSLYPSSQVFDAPLPGRYPKE